MTSRTWADGPMGNTPITSVAMNGIEADLDARVQKGDLVFNVMDYGVVGDGVADDTTALNNAATDAYAISPNAVLYMPPKTFKTTGTVTVRCSLNATAATINYAGTGTALVLGSNVSGAFTTRQYYNCPRVINVTNNTNASWDGTSIGILAVSLNSCEIRTPFIQSFEQGLVLYGFGAGCAYNTVYPTQLWGNHKNLLLKQDANGGYANQNTFIGGRFAYSATWATVDDMNGAQVDMSGLVGASTAAPNNNTFVGCSFEATNTVYYRIIIGGLNNAFFNCRYEAAGGSTPRVHYLASAAYNRIVGGTNSKDIVEVFDAGSLGGGTIYDDIGSYVTATATSGQVIPTGAYTVISSWASPLMRRCTYDGSGNFTPRPGRWRVSATITFIGNATGQRIAKLICNSNNVDMTRSPGNTTQGTMKLSGTYIFNGTSTFHVEVYQSSGADLALETTSPYVNIQADYLGS